MTIKSLCIDEIDEFVTAKINFEFAQHEKEEHKMRQEHIPELGRDIQNARESLRNCLLELNKK